MLFEHAALEVREELLIERLGDAPRGAVFVETALLIAQRLEEFAPVIGLVASRLLLVEAFRRGRNEKKRGNDEHQAHQREKNQAVAVKVEHGGEAT